jgi:hypothetical protein
MWWPIVLFAMSVVSGGILATVVGLTSAVRTPRVWWPIVGAAAIVAVIIVSYMTLGGERVMYRDVAAAGLMAASCPVVVGIVARAGRSASRLRRLLLGAAVVLTFGVCAPFVALIAHCTSGDCL